MNKIEAELLQICKKQIETKLGWPESRSWKQRDYNNLIELIESKTGTSLSLTTIKRIWKPDFKGSPQPSTLDALSEYLDYTDWLDFKTKQLENSAHGSNSKQAINKNKLYKKALIPILIFLLVLLVFLLSNSNKLAEPQSGISYNAEEVQFDCKTSVVKGVPNTVVFTYDVSKIAADSFFIQQSWDRQRKDHVYKTNKKLSSTYVYPGYHKAKLIANDSVVKQVGVRVNTNGWLALARYDFRDFSPVYIRDRNVIENGLIHATKSNLINNKVDINKDLLVSYYYINEFKGLSSSNFTFETRLKCDSIFNYSCPFIGILIAGEGAMNFIPLTIKGCVGNMGLKIGDVEITNKTHDLSFLGADVYKWQHVKIVVKNKTAKLYLNSQLVFEQPFNEDIKQVQGCNLNFTGTGIVDFVKFYDDDDNLVYETEFN